MMEQLMNEIRKAMEKENEVIEIFSVSISKKELEALVTGQSTTLAMNLKMNKGPMTEEHTRELEEGLRPVAELIVIEFVKAVQEKLIEEYKLATEESNGGFEN